MSDRPSRPILFSTPMVRAILEDRKGQTRRIAVLNAAGRLKRGRRNWHVADPEAIAACPYGVPGDLMWVREAWAHYQTVNHIRRLSGGASDEVSDGLAAYRADGHESIEDLRKHIRLMNGCDLEAIEIRGNRWRPAIHMPRWASRLTLRITHVRVERLQEISEADAIAEGITRVGQRWEAEGICATPTSAADAYRALWDFLNGYGSWVMNPWVWRVAFERVAESARAAA